MASVRGMGRPELLGSSGLDTMCHICRSNARAGWKCDLRSRLLECLRQADCSLDFFTARDKTAFSSFLRLLNSPGCSRTLSVGPSTVNGKLRQVNWSPLPEQEQSFLPVTLP